jgi:EAL domain-containing protein (putative c-di-GMP-specific phosphodiesterase class I)
MSFAGETPPRGSWPPGTRRPLHNTGRTLPALAVLLLVALWVVRFAQPDVHGLFVFAVIPVALIAMMFGWRGGLLAALLTSGVFLVWALTRSDVSGIEYVGEPLVLFVIGIVAGYYAHGALGDYDLERQALRRDLTRAIAGGELILHYQPIVRTTDGVPLAVEALVRWEHPTRGTIRPDLFIPAAERDPESIRALTLHTIEQAALFARDQLDDLPIRVAVNVSPAALGDARLPDDIGAVIRRSGVAAGRLEVEITETAFVIGEEAVGEAIARLRELGVGSVVLDDFGVGHSSLTRLRALANDGLKIDRALAGDLARPESEVIVASVMEMAHGLGLPVTAEGVEDDFTRARLIELGCDSVQGFGVSPPLTPAELSEWLAAREARPAPSA